MANIQLVFFWFAFISSTACKLQNAPHYNQLVDMVAVRFLQSSIDNFTSQLIDLQPVVKLNDYLNYEGQAFDMNSENHLLLNFIRNFSFPDMCTLVESNVSMSCCTDMNRVFTSLLLQEMWATKSKWYCFVLANCIQFKSKHLRNLRSNLMIKMANISLLWKYLMILCNHHL